MKYLPVYLHNCEQSERKIYSIFLPDVLKISTYAPAQNSTCLNNDGSASMSIQKAKTFANKVMVIVNKCISAGVLRYSICKILEEKNCQMPKVSQMQQERWLSMNKRSINFYR